MHNTNDTNSTDVNTDVNSENDNSTDINNKDINNTDVNNTVINCKDDNNTDDSSKDVNNENVLLYDINNSDTLNKMSSSKELEDSVKKSLENFTGSDPFKLIFDKLLDNMFKPNNNFSSTISNIKKENNSNIDIDFKFDPNTNSAIYEITSDETNINKDDDDDDINNICIDFYSSIGDLKSLNEWLNNRLINGKFIDKNEYTTVSMNGPSINNKVEVLKWWYTNNKKYNLPLKYDISAINKASKNGNIEILDWWINSGLELKYTYCAIDSAVNNYKINSLNWWYKNFKDNKVKFNYSDLSFNKCKLDESEILTLLKWFKENNLEIKYGKEFINYINTWKYTTVHKYLLDNKIIKESEINNNPNKENKVFNLFDVLGLGNRPPNLKKKTEYKIDITKLPEDIQKHIEEKEEELNNNIMINGKTKEYIDNLLKIPFGKYRQEKIFKFMNNLISKLNTIYKDKNIKNESDVINFFNNNDSKYYNIYKQFILFRIKYLEYVDTILNNTVYGHTSTKKQIKCILAQWLSGEINKGIVIGVQGPPGIGKTSIIKGALSKCLTDFIDYNLDNPDELTIKLLETNTDFRPFSFISLGGSTNGSTLIGHNITYHGATSGDIVKCLKEAKVMNPILYFDELDKISKTEDGYEISSVLTHITDPVQNEHFTDRYFSEVKIDLSKCIIVFSYNDASKIDRILLDRITEINMQAIMFNEKITIVKEFLIPEILKNIGYNKNDVIILDKDIENIIIEYTFEAGVRKLKEKLEEIIRNVNLEKIMNNTNSYTIDNKYIEDTFEDYPKVSLKKILTVSKVGCINGLYATSNGLGDIMHIQVKKMYSKDMLSLQTTGSLEKVISESMQVAKTVAWNLLDKITENIVINTFTNTGLHIHCPDGSTNKDGPSAGVAITCAIYSVFVNKPIKNNIAITGEIDLDGNITAIGGLNAKLTGAKRAGVNLVLIPSENKRDIKILTRKMPDLFDDTFNVKFVEHINEIIPIIF